MTDQFDLTDDQREIQELARRFTADRITPFAAEWDEKHVFPRDTIKAAAELGFAAIYVSEESGGINLGRLEAALIMEAMAYGCPATSAFISIHNMAAWMIDRFADADLKARYLPDLVTMERIASYCLTEPGSGSDAAALNTSARRDGDHYVVNGRKWWSSGVGDPRCKIGILMGKTSFEGSRHQQQSQILVPMDTPGVKIERMLSVYGYDHAPHGHGEVSFTNVRVPVENILLGEGRGFEIAQGRLGPGRIHHCMRTIGVAEVAIEKMAKRLLSRVAFGKRIADHSIWEQRIARARIDIEMTRLLCLKAADMMDKAGNKAAQQEIAMIKVQAPNMALQILDDAIQAHGGGGVAEDYGLAHAWAAMRTLRFADGPDEVHNRAIARNEFGKHGEWKAERPSNDRGPDVSSGDIGVSR